MTEKAMFGAGCFWGVEAAFNQVPGVVSTAVGYSGGGTVDPTYRDVCSGKTGHAEVVLVEFDPTVVTYERLLEAFWKIHDPTTPNRQGPDVGTQYRSAVFTFSAAQATAAEAARTALNASGKLKRPAVTAIEPARPFYRAEEYHQQYFRKHGRVGCHPAL